MTEAKKFAELVIGGRAVQPDDAKRVGMEMETMLVPYPNSVGLYQIEGGSDVLMVHEKDIPPNGDVIFRVDGLLDWMTGYKKAMHVLLECLRYRDKELRTQREVTGNE